jgi:hypothetical protein
LNRVIDLPERNERVASSAILRSTVGRRSHDDGIDVEVIEERRED